MTFGLLWVQGHGKVRAWMSVGKPRIWGSSISILTFKLVQAALTRPEDSQGPYLGTLPLTFCHAHAFQSNVSAENQSPTVVGRQVKHA